jgi:hypothetical protein
MYQGTIRLLISPSAEIENLKPVVSDVEPSFDHLIRPKQNGLWNRQADVLRGLKIDHQRDKDCSVHVRRNKSHGSGL